MVREGELGFGGGRDRFRRDYHHQPYQSRFEEKSSSFHSRSSRFGGRSNAPPSRHLWVGNLSHGVTESDLISHFLRCGELESVAFQPGRSYAFLNFSREEDAVDAIEALQGFPLLGNPLRIEFAKADKSSAPPYDEVHSQRREERSGLRESSFSQELRARNASADPFYADNSNMTDKNVEPSPVLWIGFPASLNVDEMVLRRAFSPFGEIEKITAFPGRSYAFVRFKSVISACNAKDTLHGKLFGNPRVHICFAKNDSGSSNSGRNSINVPPSPHLGLHDRQGSSENFRQDRKFRNLSGDPRTRSPQLFPNSDSGDSGRYNLGRSSTSWTGGNENFEQRRFEEVSSELRLSQDMYEYQTSPTRGKRGPLHDLSPRFPRTSRFYDEPWDIPEDAHFSHGTKRLKDGSFPPDKELPEYPFSAHENDKYGLPRLRSESSQGDFSDRKFDAGHFSYKQTSDRLVNVALPQRERSSHWKESQESLHLGSGSLIRNSIDKKRLTPESDNPSLKEWKWEGTIAKGGTPICRARCFPVGKVLDHLILPEFLDCTARTSLDMLSKHYYQATNAWVVFFVPGTDADIALYNEFMKYLEEKQRAAVAKLDEYTTLFLVPPSNFSEKVLKVPGRLSISGVVLRLEHPGSNVGSFHRQQEKENANLLSFPGNLSYPELSIHSESIHSSSYFTGGSNINLSRNVSKPATTLPNSEPFVGTESDNFEESRHEYPPHGSTRLAPIRSSHLQNSISDPRSVPSQVSASSVDSMVRQHSSVTARATLDPTAALQPEQLVQLASSLLGQHRQTQSGSTPSVSTACDFRASQNHVLQQNQTSSELSAPQSGQVHKLPQQTPNVPAVLHQIGAQGSQLSQSGGTPEADSDPQKRLQATLQLAAALLQQIQQGK